MNSLAGHGFRSRLLDEPRSSVNPRVKKLVVARVHGFRGDWVVLRVDVGAAGVARGHADVIQVSSSAYVV